MNYYEHHLGDYDGATAHLSWLEDCAYRRLICLYYRNEGPIPADMVKACRLARATSKPERDAVHQVLAEFFRLEDDGWHHKRCDDEISAYVDKAPEREARKENDRERQRRSRDRRKALFDALRSHDIVPSFDAKTSELESMLSRATSRVTTDGKSHTNTPDVTDQSHVTTRLPSPQSPVPREEQETRKEYLPASPSGLPEEKPMTAKERVWALGVSILGEKGRSKLGKLVSTHGEEIVLDALQATAREHPIDPMPWLIAACEARSKAKPNGKPKPSSGYDSGGFGPGRTNVEEDHNREPRPDWVVNAGFENIWEAENLGCYPHTAHRFHQGRKDAA